MISNENPYSAPSVATQGSAPVDQAMWARRVEHLDAERSVVFAGSLMLLTGIGQLFAAIVGISIQASWWDALYGLGAIARLGSGVLLWRRHPVGRWLHLGAWLVLMAVVLYAYSKQTQGSGFVVVLVGLGGLAIIASLWREPAKPVFEPEYRELVVPATASEVRWGGRFYVAHAILLMLVALMVVGFAVRVAGI